MPVRVGGETSLPGPCEGTSFTGYGRSALGAPSAFPQAAYPGIEAPPKDARNTIPTFVHPETFHRISLDLGMIIHPRLKAPRDPGNLQSLKTPCVSHHPIIEAGRRFSGEAIYLPSFYCFRDLPEVFTVF